MENMKKAIANRIEKELEENSFDNWHGITKENIKKHLCVPKLETYIDTSNENMTYELWTVLEENPEFKSYYTIVFEAEVAEFGLGLHGTDNKLYYVGRYGSFIDALNSM